MNLRLITNHEIIEKQDSLRSGYLRSRNGFSIQGIRRSAGSTFIALGQKIHGRCEERRELTHTVSPLKPVRGI